MLCLHLCPVITLTESYLWSPVLCAYYKHLILYQMSFSARLILQSIQPTDSTEHVNGYGFARSILITKRCKEKQK